MSEAQWTPGIYRADSIPEGEFGQWMIDRFEVEEGGIGQLHYALHGRPVPGGTYTRLVRRRASVKDEPLKGPMSPWDTIVMSDTPAELDDHRYFWGAVRLLRGHVLVHGLGLGCAVRMALQAGAEHVTVVELDQDVIDHVAPHMDPERVTVIQGDAYTYKHPVGSQWTVVWHDVWDEICSDNIRMMTKLQRKFGGRCQWQGSWSRSYLENRYV